MIKVLVNGAKGRMGQEVVKAVLADPDLELVGQIDSGDDLRTEIIKSKAAVVVDFTTATSGFKNTQIIIEAGASPVIGTSGFKDEDVKKLQAIAAEKKISGVIAPNFAIGAVLMMKFAQEAAKYLPHVEIIETHHDGKVDSPSGTAIKTAELIAQTRAKFQTKGIEDVALVPGARGAIHKNIHIHSVRLPGFVAHQEVIFGGTAQSLTIRHDSNHRESFMPGVCLACKEVGKHQQLYYGLEHLL